MSIRFPPEDFQEAHKSLRNGATLLLSISTEKSGSWTTEAKLAGFLTQLENQIKWTKELKGILLNTYWYICSS